MSFYRAATPRRVPVLTVAVPAIRWGENPAGVARAIRLLLRLWSFSLILTGATDCRSLDTPLALHAAATCGPAIGCRVRSGRMARSVLVS
jgi:hypothetical protein